MDSNYYFGWCPKPGCGALIRQVDGFHQHRYKFRCPGCHQKVRILVTRAAFGPEAFEGPRRDRPAWRERLEREAIACKAVA
jgi:hypothetical protein